MNDEISLFEKYHMEAENDLKLDDFTIKDSQLKLPGVKHKWVGRLIKQKIEKNKLEEVRKEALNKIVEQIRQDSPVLLSDKALYQQACNHELVQKIDAKIEESKVLIDYLERLEKVCSQASFDIKNVIELRKLEIT